MEEGTVTQKIYTRTDRFTVVIDTMASFIERLLQEMEIIKIDTKKNSANEKTGITNSVKMIKGRRKNYHSMQ